MSKKRMNDRSSIALQATAITGALALGSYAVYSFSKKSEFKVRIDRSGKQVMSTTPEMAAAVRSRISNTYKYLFGSIITTGATSYALYKIGFARQICQNPGPWLLTSFISSIVTMFGTHLTNYKTQYGLKHFWWMLFNMSIGSSLSVLGYFGGSIVIQSLIYTSAVMSSVSLVAMSAPNNYFLGFGSALSVGLGILNGFAFIQWLYPTADMTDLTLPYSLGLFGLFTAYDTQKVLYNAQDMTEGHEHDPINEQIDLYLDSVNLFIDIVRLLIKKEEKKDEDSKKKKKDQKSQKE